MEWYLYALISALLVVAMTLIFKKLTLLKITPPVILLFVFGFGFFFYLFHVILTKTPINISHSIILLFLFTALLSYRANMLSQKSISLAPNVGYSTAITNSIQIILVTGAGVLLFQQQLTTVKIAGAVLTIAGIVLLII